jgi:hypothetical protein
MPKAASGGLFRFELSKRLGYRIAAIKMLPCKQTDCLWHLVYINLDPDRWGSTAAILRGNPMSKTVALPLPTPSVFTRLFAKLDRLLLAYAEITIKNGDVPRCGV